MEKLIIFGAKYLIYVLIIIAIIFFLRQQRKRRKEILIFAIITLPLAYVVAKLASFFYFNPRPFVAEHFVPLIAHDADNGFPSDHTLLSSAIAASVYVFNKKWGVALFILAVLIGAARVLAGVHHAVDIVGALIISALAAWAVARWIFHKVIYKIALK
ncbi:MAG TPA: phosphatase PAP2 family protein [Patescibacteria group bacterium]